MLDFAIIVDFLEFAMRWLHVICAMAWIGSSFYFIALDLGLRRDRELASGADGEEWQVHGGGFYHIEKYLVAPKNLPEHLIWFKWESYMTWLSGAALLALIYWMGAEFFLIDASKVAFAPWQAIGISVLSLGVGWVIYDALCKSPLAARPTLLMLLLFIMLLFMGWGYNQIFSGRATMLHLGAFTATIMSANVFFIIIPNQKIVVADLRAGRVPDAKYGKIAKLRSTHNNYLTLPVVFLMLSNHYPLVFASQWNWVIAGLVFLMGVSIRHFFNSAHAKKGQPWWAWGVTAVLFVIAMWLAAAPLFRTDHENTQLSANELRYLNSDDFAQVEEIVTSNCSMCHAGEPVWAGLYWPPKSVRLDSAEAIAQNAKLIYMQSALTNAMPPRGVGFELSSEDQAIIRKWYLEANAKFASR